MLCRVCHSETQPAFSKKVLGKYEVAYYRCADCGFLQTQEPFWLAEAYAEAISVLDMGLLDRNIQWQRAMKRVICRLLDRGGRFVDYGGGTGLFTRLMRDAGFDFYRYDKYAQNVFARGFDVADIKENESRFEALTALEVFEHLPEAMADIKGMLALSDTVVFSTTLQPAGGDLENWEYLSPETGQHVAFYSRKTLARLGEILGCRVYSDGKSAHMLTRRDLKLSDRKWARIVEGWSWRLRVGRLVCEVRTIDWAPDPRTITDYRNRRGIA